MESQYKKIWEEMTQLTQLRIQAAERGTAWQSLVNRLTILHALYKNNEEEKELLAHIDKDINGARERAKELWAEVSGYDAKLDKLVPILRENILDGDTLS